MRLRLPIILVALVAVIGFLPYLLHQASQPGVFTQSTAGTVIAWSDGPDVELDADRLQKLTSEVDRIARQALGGEMVSYRITSLGKRRIELGFKGTRPLPDEAQARVMGYLHQRLPELAKEQVGP